jgi:hypothetical protein
MPHCQQLSGSNAVEECFSNNARAATFYWGALGAFLVTSVILHFRSSKWTGLALFGLAAGPWLTVFAS